MRQQSPRARPPVERASLKAAAYLHHLPRWLPPVAVAAAFIAGLAVRGWVGAALILVVAAFVAWLATLSWPVLGAQGRTLRVLAVAALIGLALWQGLR
ncbi:MAG: DUF6703 family protein [Streptosporangiaceae bacterium]